MISRERSAAARNGLPGFRPYVYKGTGQDIYRGAAGSLEDVRRLAVVRHPESMPDMASGPEWYRELADGDQDPPGPVPAAARAPAIALAPPDGDEADETAAACRRYQAAMALAGPPEPGPPPAPPPVTPASRCRRCGYLTTAAGHRVMCDE